MLIRVGGTPAPVGLVRCTTSIIFSGVKCNITCVAPRSGIDQTDQASTR